MSGSPEASRWRFLITPKWLAWHASALLAAFVMVRLGLWQWHRSEITHSAQNLGYALQWPAFAIFVVFVWYREIRNERGARPEPVRIAEPVLVRARDVAPVPAAAVEPAGAQLESDPELEEYNRLLSWLAENPGSRAADYRRANPST